jgi:hypothetical protein
MALIPAACGGNPAPSAAPPPKEPPVAVTPATPPVTSPTRACTLTPPSKWPHGASVVTIPAVVYERAMIPLLPALCSCVPDGASLTIEARIRPNQGEVRATAPGDQDVTKCLERALDPGTFEPLDLGSGTDCIDCGPRHLPTPTRPSRLTRTGVAPASDAGAPVDAGVLIVLPLGVDRARGHVFAPGANHAPDWVEGAGID